MKKLLLLIVVTFCISLITQTVSADDYADFLKSQQDSFQQYKDERDSEFMGFLKEQWTEFKVHKGLVRDPKPKPVKIPVAEPLKTEPVYIKKSKPVKKIVVPEYVSTKKDIVSPPKEKAGEPVAIEILFYATPLKILGELKLPGKINGPVNKKLITTFWDKMSQSDYDTFIKQAYQFKKEMKLNDWGYHYMLYRFGMKQFAGDGNLANLFVWFMSSKTGFESRIGYDSEKIFLLMPSRNRLFSVPFLTLQSRKYYSLTFDGKPYKFKSLYTYKGKYPKAEKLMDYRITQSPQLSSQLRKKVLTFSYKQKNYSVSTQFNKNLVTFFRYYPQTNIKVYFDALISPETEYTLVKALKPAIQNKSEAEAVNFLLRFVQKSFRYKTDDGQFGREKYLLPEETLYYPYSDCEDRSILFAFLVKRLVGLDVVGLDYPGHIATAVKFNNNFPGDYVVINNKKYMVCDPTYINARLGMAMPKFKSKKPEIVQISSL